MIRLFHALALCALAYPSMNFAASPYVGEQSRSIKSLSDQEVSDYEAGKGMGFAKAAELNGYPGPVHVLELGDELALSPEQRERTEQLFQRMQTRARALGRRLVEEERRLDELFASKAISRAHIANALTSIAALQSEIRKTHLQAHLEQSEILSESQATRYWHLRGYANGNAPSPHKH